MKAANRLKFNVEDKKEEKKQPPVKRKYVIRFGMVNPRLLSDYVIVKNPNYGERIGEWGSRPVKPDAHHYRNLQAQNKFYTRLEQSILEDGFRNPIFCNSFEEGTFCRYGTSRLWIAKRKDLEVPTIIADYVDRWTNLEELKERDGIYGKFKDRPMILELNEDEMRIDKCKQI